MRDGVLILGPTGSGKSPLGDLLETRGWGGRAARHFDFGRALREAAGGAGTLSARARQVVQRVLADGRLLEDHEFFVAAELLGAFLDACPDPQGVVLLNGLPRHVGQARDVGHLVRVGAVVHLDAPAAVLYERIRENRGGDRLGRPDDDPAAVAARLARFEARTRPLVVHYEAIGVSVRRVPVAVATQASDVLRALGA